MSDDEEQVMSYETAKNAATEWQPVDRLAAIVGKTTATIRSYCTPSQQDRKTAKYYERRESPGSTGMQYRIAPDHAADYFSTYTPNRSVHDWQTQDELAALLGTSTFAVDEEARSGGMLTVSVMRRPARPDSGDPAEAEYMYRVPAAEVVSDDADETDDALPTDDEPAYPRTAWYEPSPVRVAVAAVAILAVVLVITQVIQ